MPTHYKLILSLLILFVCCAVFYYDHTQASGWEKWVTLALGPVMVLGIWIFPEANSKEIRSEAAQRRSG